MVCSATGDIPFRLLFKVNQSGTVNDDFRELLEIENKEKRDLETWRKEAVNNIIKNQAYDKKYFDEKHKKPTKYKKGHYVMVRNVDTTVKVNKKIISKFRGPYIIHEMLPNNKFIVKDIEGFQNT